jgi:hypothetical protein
MCARVRAVVAAGEEVGSSGIDDGGGDRQSRERAHDGDLESEIKSETIRDGLLFICSKLLEAILKLEPLLIVL